MHILVDPHSDFSPALASLTQVKLSVTWPLHRLTLVKNLSYCLIRATVSKLLHFKYTFLYMPQKTCQFPFLPPEKGF